MRFILDISLNSKWIERNGEPVVLSSVRTGVTRQLFSGLNPSGTLEGCRMKDRNVDIEEFVHKNTNQA